MTIHAAKGLESPVVFLANAAQPLGGRERGIRALIEWPVEDPRPRYFHLIGKKQTIDDVSHAVLERHEQAARREEANLLYVALTRAQQILYISGCEPGRARADSIDALRHARGWYGFIESRLDQAARDRGNHAGLAVVRVPAPAGAGMHNIHGGIEYGDQPAIAAEEPRAPPAGVSIDPALTRPFPDALATREIVSPSQRTESSLDDDRPPAGIPIEPLGAAKQRGVAIHRMLELSTGADRDNRDAIRAHIEREWHRRAPKAWLDDCWQEACAVVDEPSLRRYFDPLNFSEARNEVALLYRDGHREIYGVVDRLLIGAREVVVIDYKTHRASAAQRRALTARFTPQLRLYAEGVSRLWPDRTVRALLLYTATREVVELEPIPA